MRREYIYLALAIIGIPDEMMLGELFFEQRAFYGRNDRIHDKGKLDHVKVVKKQVVPPAIGFAIFVAMGVMLYPGGFERKTGFDQVREILKGFCQAETGVWGVDRMEAHTSVETLTPLLHQTEEFRQILASSEPFPSQDYYNILPLLQHLRPANTFPEPEQLAEFRLALKTWLAIVTFFSGERSKKYPALYKLVYELPDGTEPDEGAENSSLHPVRETLAHIDRILDERTRIRDNASPELHEIRRKMNRIQGQAERRINQLFAEARKSGWTDDDAEITIRDGRLVIPFRSTHKRKMPGVVHDASSTGQTIYLEPVELVELHNEIRELSYAEHREIIRILTGVADRIRPLAEYFQDINDLLGNIDFIRAKARFALQTGGRLCASFSDEPEIGWEEAVHPILYLTLQKSGKPTVPLTISLSGTERVLVISGPNAGGKSICLKTVGLIQYMFQCGMLPPAREDSVFGIFHRMMIDIGDEQSLENDLSTYTSKLLHMKFFMEHLDPQSLFLIDEMGTGTDPAVGGAIAEVALIRMAESGACGVVTTHYSNLKLLAGRVTGVINGAMLFDSRELRPLYRLKSGTPGSSFALEIAGNIGFPEEAIGEAAGLIGHSLLDFEQQLQDLEVEKQEVEKKQTGIRVADELLHDLIARYEKSQRDLEKSKKEILEKASREAKQVLDNANKLIENTIREIRETQADREHTRKVRQQVDLEKERLEKSMYQPAESNPDETEKSEKGKDKSSGKSRKESVKRIIFEGQADLAGQVRKRPSVSTLIRDKQEHFTLTIDLRGKRADEAFADLQRFIDDAILLGTREVRVLHGKGTGALRQLTRDYLRTVPEVEVFRDAEPETGGSGITEVRFV